MSNQPKQPHSLVWPLDKLAIHVVNGGRRKKVAPGASEQLLRISGDPATSAHMTVTLFQERSEPDVIPPPATAIVKWGGSGTQTVVEADFKHGCMLTLPAAFVEIIGRNDGEVDTELGAFIGYMPYFKQWSATKTVAFGLVGGGTSVSVPIPDFAIELSVITNPFNSAPNEISFLDRSGVNIGGYSGLSLFRDTVPIPNDAIEVVISASAIAITQGRVIFNLAL